MKIDVERAVETIRSVADRLCENQLYCFDDYDPAIGDATPVCNRLGIPVTDDIVIAYPAKATFSPLRESKIRALENSGSSTEFVGGYAAAIRVSSDYSESCSPDGRLGF